MQEVFSICEVEKKPRKCKVTEWKAPDGTIWESKKKLKTNSIYYSCPSSGETRNHEPEGLSRLGDRDENYAPPLPEPSSWNKSDAATENVTVNCFHANLEKSLYRYEVLELEEQSRRGVRWKFSPRGRKMGRELRKQLGEKLGKGNWIECDGFIISTREVEEDFEVSHEDYVVKFRNHGNVLNVLKDENIEYESKHEQSTQMLSYGLHELAFKAGFQKDTIGNKVVLWKNVENNGFDVRNGGSNWERPDVTLWRTFQAKLTYAKNPESGEQDMYVHADVSHKHITRHSLRDIIRHFQDKYPSKQDWQRKVEEALVGRNCMIKYSSAWVKIKEFDWEANEETKLDHLEIPRGSGNKWSLKQFMEEKKELSVKTGEACVVICKEFSRGRVNTNEFLPQCIYPTVSKEQTTAIDMQIKKHEQMDANDRIRAVKDFIGEFDSVECDTFPLKITTKPYEVKGYTIPDISLVLNGNRMSPAEFAREWRGVSGFSGEKENEPRDKRIAVVSTSDRAANDVKYQIQQYTGPRGRNVDSAIDRIEVQTVRNFTEKELKSVLEDGDYDLVLAVLSNGREGSMEKAILSRVTGPLGIPTQCVIQGRNTKGTPFKGCMDDAMAKLGGVWYTIDYDFEKFDSGDFWVMGIDNYTSQSNEQLSGLSIQLCTNIVDGTLVNLIRGSFPINPKKNIAPFEAVEAALNKVFEKAKEKDISPPKHILVFRGGISIGEVDILRTNELVALIRAVYSSYPKKSSRPKLSYFMVPKGSQVRFSKTRKPVAVVDTITGGFLADFYTQVNVKSRLTPRIIRYICLHDEGFFENAISENPNDFLRLLHGLAYLYPQSIPFMNGPCSYPGPLKTAQNRAENFTQYVSEDHERLEDLDLLPDSLTDSIRALKLGEMEADPPANEESMDLEPKQ